MEYKLIKIVAHFFLLIVFFGTSCGWLEDDSVIFEQKIYGNFYVVKRENDSDYNLTYKLDQNTDEILLTACVAVYFDSTKMSMYVHERRRLVNFYYYLNIHNAFAESSQDAMARTDIDSSRFYDSVRGIRASFVYKHGQ